MPSAVKVFLGLALCLAIGWGYVLYRAQANEARAEASHPPEGQFINIGGIQVHAVVMGDGPDLVLLHGASGNTRDMTFALGPELAQRYRVIVLDRPGLGYTDPIHDQGASISEQADLLSQAAQALGAERPIVLGHSYGGAVALAWAVNHPDRIGGVVALSAASHPWDTGLSTYYKILSHPVLGRIVIPMITAFVPERRVRTALEQAFAPGAVPNGYMEHFGPRLSLRRFSLHANARQRANLHSEITALSQHYPSLSAPLEVLHGTDDKVVGFHVHSTPLAKAVPGAQLTPLAGLGHMTQHDAQSEVIQAIDRIASRTAGLR